MKAHNHKSIELQFAMKKNWERIAGDRLDVIHELRRLVRRTYWLAGAAVVIAAAVGVLIGKAI